MTTARPVPMGRKASQSRTQLPGAVGWQTSSSFASGKTRSFAARGLSTLRFQRSLTQLRRPSRTRSRLLVTSSRSGFTSRSGARWVHNPVPAQREVPRRVRALPHALVALPPRREAAHRDLTPAAARAGRSGAERNGSTRCANRCSKRLRPAPCGADVARNLASRLGVPATRQAPQPAQGADQPSRRGIVSDEGWSLRYMPILARVANTWSRAGDCVLRRSSGAASVCGGAV